MSGINLDCTDNCPVGHRCESCGRESDDLRVVTAATPMGVLCITACPRCASAEMTPPVAVGTAMRLTAQHASHLGIDLDQMAAAMECDR